MLNDLLQNNVCSPEDAVPKRGGWWKRQDAILWITSAPKCFITGHQATASPLYLNHLAKHSPSPVWGLRTWGCPYPGLPPLWPVQKQKAPAWRWRQHRGDCRRLRRGESWDHMGEMWESRLLAITHHNYNVLYYCIWFVSALPPFILSAQCITHSV